ncbi:RNA polymerase sigma factor [Paraconexibacter sp. AEG42_29]|uniref:RNA polymerase sigma factor n=1 Tax=Paraconexibacter sp. AEG42_29 TaxID=2997339 RepID=A0AAU7ASE1_9ACTN
MTPTATATLRSLAPTRACGDDTSDDELVAALRTGDDRAFEQLYQRYHRRVAAYVYGMVRDHGRAEDISQEVFISALRRMRETDRPIAFKPWIYEIAKNACIDHFRRSRRGEEVSYDAGEGDGGADYGRVLASVRTPDTVVDEKQAIDNLCGAFGGLSETHHQILVMRELEGLSYRQIGEQLGMSRPAVESTLFRARRRLAEEYQELVSGERCRRVQGIIAGAGEITPGIRDRRRLAVHISHCQPCRRTALAAGLEVKARTVTRARVAAFLPLPAFLRRRGTADLPVAPGGGHGSSAAQWAVQLSSSLDPALAGWVKAAAAAATVAAVGVGAGHSLDRPDRAPSARSSAGAVERPAPASSARRAASKPVLLPVATALVAPAVVAAPVVRRVEEQLTVSKGPVAHRIGFPPGGGTPPAPAPAAAKPTAAAAPAAAALPESAKQILEPLSRTPGRPAATLPLPAVPVTAAVQRVEDALSELGGQVEGAAATATAAVTGASGIVAGD